MSRALLFTLLVGKASSIEWKGVFYTPEDTYKWGAEKVSGGYVDPAMKLVAIPVAEATQAALTSANSKGTAAFAMTCEDVQSGGTIIPKEAKCYKLIFDASKAQSLYTVNAAGVKAVAFFAEHLPTEFEATEHYFKDTTGVDIEPQFQDPVPSAGGHDHSAFADEFEGKCVCQAKKHGWKLDCNNKAKIEAAVAALQGNTACAAKGAPDACTDNYYIMQAHHDHCLHDALPTGIEKALHDYEHFYNDCFVKRQFNPKLKACPKSDCKDSQKMTTAIATLQAGCSTATACASATCSAAMKTVLMVHDTCPEDVLPNNLETALHDHEEACEAQLCNSADAAFDPYADPCMAKVSAANGFGSQEAFWVTMAAFLMATSA